MAGGVPSHALHQESPALLKEMRKAMNVQRIARFVIVWHLLLLWCLLLLPTAAWAQVLDTAAIAGVARDASGAVLPGVTVEAASPALIEKSRTVVTDDRGQYKIVDLRPGTYT